MFVISICAGCYGLCNVVTLYAGWLYYPNRKGMVTGILLSSHGFLGVFTNIFIIEIINPNNEKASIKVMEGY